MRLLPHREPFPVLLKVQEVSIHNPKGPKGHYCQPATSSAAHSENKGTEVYLRLWGAEGS